MANLEENLSVERARKDRELLQQFIKQDPENIMSAEFLTEHPTITFQVLAKAKLIDDRTWTEIADELKIAPTTLCSFFNRRLKKLMPYFKKYLQE